MMAEDKKIDVENAVEEVLEKVEEAVEKVEEKVEETVGKSLEEFKDAPENKKAIAKAEGKAPEVKEEKKVSSKRDDSGEPDKKTESKPAVVKTPKKKSKPEEKVLEREYVVPMRKGFLNVPHYRRAKKAVKTLKEFMVRHMAIRDRDTRKIKVDINLNNEIWFRGIKKPLNKIKVKAVKKDGIVTVTLADVPKYVKFKMAREEKKRKLMAAPEKAKAAPAKKIDKDANKDGVDDKVEAKEDAKSEAEKDAKAAKVEAAKVKHTTKGAHEKKTTPRKSNPKK